MFPYSRIAGLICIAWSFIYYCHETKAQVFANLTFESDPSDRAGAPIVIEIPEQLASNKQLQLIAHAERIPVQWIDQAKRTAAFILPNGLKPADVRNYRLEGIPPNDKQATESEMVTIRADQASHDLQVMVRDKPLLSYAVSTHQPPDNLAAYYARSGHIHPVYTPGGKQVTAEFPPGHPHQHGVFNAWVNTTFENHPVDFWNQQNRTGKVEHVRVVGTENGRVFGAFTIEQLHSDISQPQEPKPVLKEFWTVRSWMVANGFLFDIESRQTCIAQTPLKINEYHYGGMGFRGHDQWFGQKGADFLTSEGKTRADGNHSRPKWAIAHGNVDGQPCYMAIMGHPSNFRHPEPVRLHPDMPYFVFTPPQQGPFEIAPGQEHSARYRFFVSDGKPDPDQVNRIWNDYAQPVKITVTNP